MNSIKWLKKVIIQKLSFDPDNELDCLNAVKQDGYCIQYINNPSEEIQLEAVKQNTRSIKLINNPSKEVQKLAIELSKYNIYTIALCPDWREFAEEIMTNIMIKDIIE